jgi:hypothetical protein
MNSQNFRTTNGRIAILAYAIGEESFTDRNGNGWFDISLNELVDLNGASTDLPEAWLDVNEKNNENAYADEPFIDFNSNGSYTRGDGKFNGVSCDDVTPGRSSAGSCGASKSIHVRGRAVVLFSGSAAQISSSAPTVDFATCSTGSTFTPPAERTLVFTVSDARGNVMPAGTTVAIATTNGIIRSLTTDFTVPNSIACVASFPGCPASAPKISTTAADGVGSFAVTIASDATQSGTTAPFTCSNTASSGTLTVTVTTPSGQVTRQSIQVRD